MRTASTTAPPTRARHRACSGQPTVIAAFSGESTLAVADGQVICARRPGHGPPLTCSASRSPPGARAATLRSIAALAATALQWSSSPARVAAAWVLASRLARFVEALGRTAAGLDDGDVTVETAARGIDEVDQVARALTVTGEARSGPSSASGRSPPARPTSSARRSPPSGPRSRPSSSRPVPTAA